MGGLAAPGQSAVGVVCSRRGEAGEVCVERGSWAAGCRRVTVANRYR